MPGPGSGAREREHLSRTRQVEAAIVQPVNHTNVVSIQDLEELISEARLVAQTYAVCQRCGKTTPLSGLLGK